jgi:hypothetical protein
MINKKEGGSVGGNHRLPLEMKREGEIFEPKHGIIRKLPR